MSTILNISQLSKSYGKVKALQQLDMSIERGQVHGILGPNGSGKTTTLGIILGVLNADNGSFDWFGTPVLHRSLQRIGAILETPNFYPYLSAVKNLEVVRLIKGVEKHRIDEVLEQVNLAGRKHDKFSTYSLGMKQRLAIASALLNEPEILVLDEPTNGLDPQGIAEVRELIMRIAREGTTILIASHLLDEIEKVCSHVTILKQGKRLFTGPVDEVFATAGLIEVGAVDRDALEKACHGYPGIKSISHDARKLHLNLEDKVDPAALNKFLAEQGILVDHLVYRKSSLEQQFLELVSKSK
ncbi:MAG: ATP-binding cassette domain-containing protein [Flavobacteriales bacterium]|nr:ATP-binding cassette domain-containing protein [Flavobacteriales bacterium]